MEAIYYHDEGGKETGSREEGREGGSEVYLFLNMCIVEKMNTFHSLSSESASCTLCLSAVSICEQKAVRR